MEAVHMSQSQDRPNIIFLLNDHQAYYRHGWDGGPEVQRPCFDRLAAQGVEFTRAYTACPLCGPARRTMLTGLYPHNHGEIKNDSGHPYDREVYLDVLAEAGYRNYYYGKWHAGSGTAYDHGCEGFNYLSYGNPYITPEYKQYLQEHELPEPEIWIEKNFTRNVGEGKDNFRYKQDREWCNEHASGILLTPKETHEAFFLAHLACKKLTELAESGDGQPFAMRVDFWGPHQPYFPTQEYADLYPPEQIPQYGSFADDLSAKPDLYAHESNYGISEQGRLTVPNPLPWSEWQKVLSRCYGQITMMDEAAGRIIRVLDELGLADNTLVIWTTDHGDAVACHGGHFDKKSYMPEEVIRIPLALRYPREVPAGQSSDKLVGNIDYAPTMLDAAGIGFAGKVDGQSLLPLCADPTHPWREFIVSETHGHMENAIGRAFIGERYKYVYNEGDLDELYDLQEDPYELTNLVFSQTHKDTHIKLKNAFAEWRARSGDTRQLYHLPAHVPARRRK
jgi:arylsulfatase A-like enzyme